MKSILFSRISTKEQSEKGYSLSTQVSLLEEYAKKQTEEIEIVKKFQISGTAKKNDLSHWEYLEKNPEVIVLLCQKMDRLVRNFNDAIRLGKWLDEDENRQAHFVGVNLVIHKNSSSSEQFQWEIYHLLAKQYGKDISARTQEGLIKKANEGYYPGSPKRGYVVIGGERRQLIIDESNSSEAPHIKRVFELYEYNGPGNVDRLIRQTIINQNKP